MVVAVRLIVRVRRGRPSVKRGRPETFIGTPLRKSFVLTARASKEWPGIKDPGESKGESPRAGAAKRRKVMAPGVPDDTWGPR